jgi:hypothetical protein
MILSLDNHVLLLLITMDKNIHYSIYYPIEQNWSFCHCQFICYFITLKVMHAMVEKLKFIYLWFI